MRCSRCDRQLVVIDLEIRGETVALYSCSACDLRWWEGRDGRIPLDGVLNLVSEG